jgi:hypothetical protein
MIHQFAHASSQHLYLRFQQSVPALDFSRFFHQVFLLSLLLVSALAGGFAVLFQVDGSCRPGFNVFGFAPSSTSGEL